MFEMQYFLAAAPAVIGFLKSWPARSMPGRFGLKRSDCAASLPGVQSASAKARHLGNCS